MKQQTLTGFEKYGKTTRRAPADHEDLPRGVDDLHRDGVEAVDVEHTVNRGSRTFLAESSGFSLQRR